MEQHAPNSPTRFGVFELDVRSGELRKAGTRIRLQDQPLKILIALLEQPGVVVTREELKRRIWPHESFGDFDHAVNVAVAKLRAALSDSADTPRYVETLPRRGYRFIFPLASIDHARNDHTERSAQQAVAPALAPAIAKQRFKWLPTAATGVIGIAVAASVWWVISHRPKEPNKLTDQDTVVLADFENTTGDPVFDGTIRQGLAAQLGQSPFLRLVSDATVRQTLRLMSQLPDARLTPEIAQQLCMRTASTAVLDGSIAKLGNQYVLGLRAINCRTGDLLVQEQVTADGKEEVLKALAQAASQLRTKLGESVGTVQRFNTPLDQVTTPSIEALHAYSLGRTLIYREDRTGAIQLFQRAIALDPNFAMAYASLGLAYAEYSETQSVANFRKAYELREHVSDRERLYIEAHYHDSVMGDWEKARQVYELWSRLYPRDDIPYLNVSGIYSAMGLYEQERTASAESLRLLPGDCLSYGVLLSSLLHLDRLDEAGAVLKSAEQQNTSCLHLQLARYELAFLLNDKAEMARIVSAQKDKRDNLISHAQAQTAAFDGRLGESRELVRRAALSARQSNQEELGVYLEESAAESEALFGDFELAKRGAREALTRPHGRDVEGLGAVTLALAGDETGARSLARDLARRFPQNTLVQTNYLPSVRALLALNHLDTAKVLENLLAAAPYESGDYEDCNAMFPIYLRGQAYLMARRGREAATEFQKIIGHPGIVLYSPIGALARLQLARALAMEGQAAQARAAYRDFLTLWKDADPDIPILKQAQTEYAKLH